MRNKPQTLVDAVRDGDTTDAGAMTTTQDVTDVVPYDYSTVDEALRALALEGVVESTTFGNERVWVVPDDDETQDETIAGQSMYTSTRGPVQG
jgi:hypothetical protein